MKRDSPLDLIQRYLVLVSYLATMVDEYIMEDNDDVDPFLRLALAEANTLRVVAKKLLKEVAK